MKSIAVITAVILFAISFGDTYADAPTTWQTVGGYSGGYLGAAMGMGVGALPSLAAGLESPYDTFWSFELMILGFYAGGIIGSSGSVYEIGKLAGENGTFRSTLFAGGITSGISFLALQLMLLAISNRSESMETVLGMLGILFPVLIIGPIIATPIVEVRTYQKSNHLKSHMMKLDGLDDNIRSGDKDENGRSIKVNLVTLSF